MRIQSHSGESHSPDLNSLHGMVEGVLFGAVIWIIGACLYVWVSGALSKPGNPVAEVYRAIAGDMR